MKHRCRIDEDSKREEINKDLQYDKSVCVLCGVEVICCKLCDFCFDADAPEKYRLSIDTYFRRHISSSHLAKRRRLEEDVTVDADDVEANNGGEGFCDFDNTYDDVDEIMTEEALCGDNVEANDGDDDDDDQSTISFEDKNIVPVTDDEDEDEDWSCGINSLHDFDHGSVTISHNCHIGYEDFAFFQGDNVSNPMELNNNQLYFYEMSKAMDIDTTDKTGGWRSLCYRASVGNRTDTTQLADHDVSEMFFCLNSALLTSTKGEQADNVMRLIQCIKKSAQKKVDRFYTINSMEIGSMGIPEDYTEARRVLLDGCHSVMKNFPAPKVFFKGNHACVSLKEVIQMLAGHHGNFDFCWDTNGKHATDGLNITKGCHDMVFRVRKELEKIHKPEDVDKHSIGFVSFWSDSFLKSFVKQKDNSVWLFCVTISPPMNDISKGTYTQVLAIGKSGQDHTDVVNHYFRELEELEKGFKCYFGDSNTIRDVAFSLLYYSCDRPEKQSRRETLAEGHFGKVSNYSAAVSAKLPACKECYTVLAECLNNGTNLPERNCDKCFFWNIDPDDHSQEDIPVNDDYPITRLTDLDGNEVKAPLGREPGRTKIGPVRLSSEWLIQACTYAYGMRRLKSGRGWTSNQFHEYLRTCCISKARRTIIENIALNDREEDKFSPSNKYVPEVWLRRDCFDHCMFPDMPMHALAHGIGGDVIQFFHEIFASMKRATDFTKFANDIILDIAGFGLDWCKPKTYPKSAWVGENIMAFLRLFSYLYGMYLLNNPFQQQHHALQQSMMRMMNALQSMISYLMSLNVARPEIITGRVKLFLSASHFCDDDFVRPEPERKQQIKITDMLSIDEVMAILHDLHITAGEGRDPKVILNNITSASLVRILESKKLKPKGKKKSELQMQLFDTILDRDLEACFQSLNNLNNTLTGPNPSENKKTYVWDKGAWLSFVTNIAEQIEMLGPLRWIWYLLHIHMFIYVCELLSLIFFCFVQGS